MQARRPPEQLVHVLVESAVADHKQVSAILKRIRQQFDMYRWTRKANLAAFRDGQPRIANAPLNYS